MAGQQGSSCISTEARGDPQQNSPRRSRTDNALGRVKFYRPQGNVSPGQTKQGSGQPFKEPSRQKGMGSSPIYIPADCQPLGASSGRSVCLLGECQASRFFLCLLQAKAVDALTYLWNFTVAYAFPPLPLIARFVYSRDS